MQRSYIDYAMSVIVGRALPEVRDGLKPVHRRVLYAMFDSGFRPDRSHAKSARSVAETMGNYHPHGDASIYDTLVRMAQPWSLRYPLVDGQGNFGSPGNDPPAAMRYCLTGDALVRLPFGQSVRIGDVVPGARPNSDNVIELKVLTGMGIRFVADQLFHSGEHQTYKVRTAEGYEVTGTANHPLLCLVDVGGVPTLLWKLIEEIRPDDYVVLQRTPPMEFGPADWHDVMEALLLGAFISEGYSLRDPGRLRQSGPRLLHDGRWQPMTQLLAGSAASARQTNASGSRMLRAPYPQHDGAEAEPPVGHGRATLGRQVRTGMAVARTGGSKASVPAGTVRG